MKLLLNKTLIAALTLAILLPLLSFTIIKTQPIDPKIARAEAIARIEDVEDMEIKSSQSLAGNVNTRSLTVTTPKKDVFVNGEMVVKFKTLEDKKSFADEKGVSYNLATKSRLTKLKVGDNYDMKMTEDAISNLKTDSRIEYVEPVSVGFSNSTPNDTYYNQQWYMKNNGDLFNNSKSNYDLNIQPAYDITTGNSNTVIAIIDSNLDFPNTPEIADAILRDVNGKVIGKNISLNCDYTDVNGVLNPSCDTTDTQSDHSTKGAGLIAAKTDDGKGIAGICPSCKIMPLGISDKTNVSMLNAINFAIANGADIITTSVSFNVLPSLLSSLNTGVQNAINGGLFFVATAGNCGYALDAIDLVGNNCRVGSKQNSSYPICVSSTSTPQEKLSNGCVAPNEYQYPGSFDNVISVSGFDSGGKNTILTANDKVKISAPGYDLLTTTAHTALCSDTVTSSCCGDRTGLSPTDKLYWVTGTSFAAPIVAGVLGLVKSQFPNSTPQNYSINMLGREAGQFVYSMNSTLAGKMGIGAINACGALGGCVGSANALTGYSFGTPNPNVVDPISGKIGGLFPTFSLANQTFPTQTIVKFVPVGCTDSTAVNGKIENNAFIPVAGSLIPSCSTLGAQSGNLKYTLASGNSNVNIQTNVNTNFVSSTSTAPILGLSNTIISGVVGSSLITIPLTGNTLNNGIYIFIPAGCEETSQPVIHGSVINNSFVANAGEVIPNCATTGPNSGTLDAIIGTDVSTAQSVGVLTNFSIAQSASSSSSSISSISSQQSLSSVNSSNVSSSSSIALSSSSRSNSSSSSISVVDPELIPVPKDKVNNSGGVIIIGNQNSNLQGNMQSVSSSSLTASSNVIQTQPIIAQPTKAYSNGNFKSKITIEDPYICGQGSYGNVPEPKKFGVENVYYEFYKVGSTTSSYNFKLKLNDNGDFFLPITPSTNVIVAGDYRVVYYAYDNEGNKAQGEYTNYITDDCTSPKLSKNVPTIRTGGPEIINGLIFLLSIVMITFAYRLSKSKGVEFK